MDKELEKASKDRLIKSITTKMRTIMIGSLAAIEDELISKNDDIHLQNVYNNVRQRILDLGNTQIRNLTSEVEDYTIQSNRFCVKMEVKNGRNNNG